MMTDDVDDCCGGAVDSGLGTEGGDRVGDDLQCIFTQVPAVEFFKALGWDEVDNDHDKSLLKNQTSGPLLPQ